jgi:GINS complex subunit 3
MYASAGPSLLPDPSRLSKKTFRARLVEVIDQAQHFAALGPVGAGGPSGDSAQAFREGLDATERERECCSIPPHFDGLKDVAVFTLAQESAKRTKKWYDESDKPRR